MDGAGGMIGASYLGEVAPKDGTTLGYFTGSAWRYASDPERFRVDFRSYEFVAYQPGTSIAYMRTDVPPGIKEQTDIVKAKGVVAGGLGAENSKDLLLRLGARHARRAVQIRHLLSRQQAARLALQQNEINLYAEVAAELPRGGRAEPGERTARRSASGTTPIRAPRSARHARTGGGLPASCRSPSSTGRSKARRRPANSGTPIAPCSPSTARCSGRSCCRRACRGAALAALRAAVLRLNDDKEHAEEAARTIGFVPEWVAGPDTNNEVRAAITVAPDMRAFIADYIRRASEVARGEAPFARTAPRNER